jgi:hypothetical protein
LLFLLPLLFVFCKNEVSKNQLFVAREDALRDAPGEKSAEIRRLKAGEKVTDLGEVSSFETPIMFDDTLLTFPWIKVQTVDNQIGWAYAEYLKPNAGLVDKWLLDKRLICYFGKQLAARYGRFIASQEPNNETEFAAQYREAVALRDTFIHLLANRPDPNSTLGLPYFSWMRDLMPGFIFQSVAEGTQPYFFADYLLWQQKALKTSGLQDDAFVETCLAAFAADSIESFYPAWTFQISDYEAASQLGTGVHLKMFRQIESALKTGALFQPELMRFKESVLEDILANKTGYWQSKDLILKELNQILEADFSCLNARDRVALQARLTVLEDPEAHGVNVNLRSGM